MSLDHENIKHLHTGRLTLGLSNVTRNWVIITGISQVLRKGVSRNLIVQDWNLLLRRWRDTLRAHSVLRYQSSSGQTHVIRSRDTRIRERGKRTESVTRITWYSDQGVESQGYHYLTSDFVMYREAKGIVYM